MEGAAKPPRPVDLSALLREPPGIARVSFTPGKPIVEVRINGAARALLLLDTGADSTMIAPRVLEAAGVVVPRGSATVRGVTGEATLDVYEVTSLETGGARVNRLTVVGHDTGEHGVDGLLGRDFLNHFNYTIDNAAGQVTLSPK